MSGFPCPKEKQSFRVKFLGRFDLQQGKCGQSQSIVMKAMRTQESWRDRQRAGEGKKHDSRLGGWVLTLFVFNRSYLNRF